VAAVLGDALHRVAALGGREGMPRSLGSVYGGSIARFLGGCREFERIRTIETRVKGRQHGVAVSVDGSTLLVSDTDGGSHAIHVFRVGDGSRLHVIGCLGRGPLQLHRPMQVCIAADGFVFVADWGNHRVQVLTPTLDFHGVIGERTLVRPAGVCANADVVVVSETAPAHRICVFERRSGVVVRRFGREGSGAGKLDTPRGLCFLHDGRHVAVAERYNDRVSVFSVDGEFIRHVGVGALYHPLGVACTADDELVICDTSNCRIAVYSASGGVVLASHAGAFTAVAVHGSTVFGQLCDTPQCVVLAPSTR
jgi:DNA-binding beta-propeller fold protein YncE